MAPASGHPYPWRMEPVTREYIDESFERLTAFVTSRFEAIEARLGRIEERQDRIEERLDRLERRVESNHFESSERFISVEERLRTLGARIDRVEEKVDTTGVRLEGRAEALAVTLSGMRAEAGQFRSEVTTRLDGVDRRLDGLGAAVVALNGRLDDLSDDMRQRFRVLN